MDPVFTPHIRLMGGLLTLFSLSLSGCMTQLAPLPAVKVSTEIPAQTGPILGIADIKDTRLEQEVGMEGGLRIAVGNDLVPYLDAILRQHLTRLGFRVVSAPDPTTLQGVSLDYIFNGKVVQVTVKNISFGSIDPILDPADAAVTIYAQVYERNGQEIYAATHIGEYTKRIGLTIPGKTEGKIIAVAAENAVKRLAEDKAFRDAIK